MKKGRKAFLIIAIVVVALVAIMAIAATSGMGAVKSMTVRDVDLSQVPDGSFKGQLSKGRFKFTVQVAIKDHRISAISLLEPKTASEAVTKAAERIIEKQTPAIDTVSGASLTTRAFAGAVENALANAK